MPKLFVAAYLVSTDRERPASPNPIALRFSGAAMTSGFPYDLGDDPAFFSASECNGPVTWGVCRPDVRGAIAPGDWIAFFSASHPSQETAVTHYRFVAALCVERKIRQVDIFVDSSHCLFRDYLNLLVRPNGAGWEHYEPGLAPSKWHRDWLWRLCERRGLRKKQVIRLGDDHHSGDELPRSVAENYIIFSTGKSVIASKPPLVAVYRKGDTGETWEPDRRAQHIREHLFGTSSRGLRTTNPQQPHRHFRRELPDSTLPQAIFDVLAT